MDSLEMLKTEEGQLNAVFACYGSAAQHARYFEQALAQFLVAYNRLTRKELTVADLEGMEAKIRKQTMGTLLKMFRGNVTVGDKAVDEHLSEALQMRNFLMHEYFLKRERELTSETGRLGMLRELVTMDSLLQTASDLTNGMRVALCEALQGRRSPSSGEKPLFTIDVRLPDDA